MHTLVCRVFKWNYEQLLYGQTFLPTDIRFARANAPLNDHVNYLYCAFERHVAIGYESMTKEYLLNPVTRGIKTSIPLHLHIEHMSNLGRSSSVELEDCVFI